MMWPSNLHPGPSVAVARDASLRSHLPGLLACSPRFPKRRGVTWRGYDVCTGLRAVVDRRGNMAF
jgi:hypothetical protein